MGALLFCQGERCFRWPVGGPRLPECPGVLRCPLLLSQWKYDILLLVSQMTETQDHGA